MIKIQIICQHKINHFLDTERSSEVPHHGSLAYLCKGRGLTKHEHYMSLSIKVKAVNLFNYFRVRRTVQIHDFISLNR